MARRPKPPSWQTNWIWGCGGWPYEQRNTFCYARKTFRLGSEPVSADCRITADNRYQLFVNGRFVCRGPARCEPRYQSYDEMDLAPYLHKGRNVVAALMHHYGESTMQSLERGGWGFLLDGEVRCRSGPPAPIHTDGSWKACLAEGYNRKTSRYIIQLGFQEDFDAAASPADWKAVNFSDRDWPAATVLGPAERMPYENLEPRGIPFEREEFRDFAGTVSEWVGANYRDYRTTDNIARTVIEERRTRPRGRIFTNDYGCLRGGRGYMTVATTPPGRHHALVFNAGCEVSGFLELDVEATGDEIIDFFFCEHVRPNGEPVLRCEPKSVFTFTNYLCDRYRCRPGRQRHRFFAWKGFRYVLAVFRDVRKPLKVHRLGYTFTSYPVERRGSFWCSDERLNIIWETGVYTQQLCMHDAYMDCPWREQAQWWGDARVQWRVNQAAFGDAALFRRGLRQAAQSQIASGLTYGVFPCEMHGCILPDYTLVWVCSIWDYYFYTGDDSPIREHFDTIVKAMAWFEPEARRRHGVLGHPGHGLWLFLDWAPLYKGESSATFTFQYIEALRTAALLARHLGRDAEARKWSAQARQVERSAVRFFWDPRGRQFFEGYDFMACRPVRQVAQHANAYAILADVQKRYHGDIAHRICWIQENYDSLFKDNTGGNEYHEKARHPIASSFFYAYVLEAMFKANRHMDAMAGIRKLWGWMLDQGATTWFETWNHTPEFYAGSSACHAWSSSPTYHLSEQVGGAKPAAPGFEKVRIIPQLFDLDYARVCAPTPRGPIEIDWERIGRSGMDLRAKLPKRVTATLEMPDGTKRRLGGGTHRVRCESS